MEQSLSMWGLGKPVTVKQPLFHTSFLILHVNIVTVECKLSFVGFRQELVVRDDTCRFKYKKKKFLIQYLE